MFIILSGIMACALFEKQTVVQGEEPTGPGDTGVTQDTGNLVDTGDTAVGDTGDTGSGDTGNGDTGSEDTGIGNGVTNNMNSSNSELAQSVDCTGDYSAYDYDNEAECFTDFLSCGDQILVSTGGGTNYFDSALYTSWYAMNSKDATYEGPERGYYFMHPGDGSSVVFTLESPCEDMDLLYFKSYDMGDCYEGSCAPCQQDNDISDESYYQNDSFEIFDTNPNSYLIIVEAADNGDHPFVLTVECN